MTAPTITPEQRESALAKSAEARRERRELLDALAAQRVALADVLARSDNVARKTRVAQVIRALPGYGPTRTAKAMAAAGVDGRKRVGGLGARQRGALVDAVG